MKGTIILVTFILCALSQCIFAQIHTKGTPMSFGGQFRMEYDSTNVYKLKTHNTKEIDAKLNEVKKCKDCKGDYYGIGVDFILDIRNDVNHEKIGGQKLWRANLHLDKAKGVQLYFGEYHLPKGASLFIYNEERTMVLGAFTHLNNNQTNTLFTQVIEGDNIHIEYSEPDSIGTENAKLKVTKAIQVFKDFFAEGSSLKAVDDYVGVSNLCNLDVNCQEGLPYSSEKRAIGIMTQYDWNLNLTAFCSGSLINTSSTVRKPYFLTAKHCFSGASINNYGYYPSEWVIYFNFESTQCGQSPSEARIWANKTNSISGAQIISMGNATDYLLLKLNDDPSVWYNVLYLGWDRSSTANTGGLVGIHHPKRDLKKISIFNGTPSKVSIDVNDDALPEVNIPGYNFTHWRVTWSQGKVQEGSSGSPLITKNGRKIIGILTSATNTCEYCLIDKTIPCVASYGALSESWYKADAGYPTLANLLDPTNSGLMSIGTELYKNYSCNDDILNGNEAAKDCGGDCPPCPVTPTCYDNARNGMEAGVDCGGPCPACPVPSCTDKIRNQNETGIDCGGVCAPCSTLCNDGKWNGDELEMDCGGSCAPCPNLIDNPTFDVNKTCLAGVPDPTGLDFIPSEIKCLENNWHESHGWPYITASPTSYNLNYGAKFPYLTMRTWEGKIRNDVRYNYDLTYYYLGCGVFTELKNYLDPGMEYTLYFSERNICGSSDGGDDCLSKHGVRYIDLYAAGGLKPTFTVTDAKYWDTASVSRYRRPKYNYNTQQLNLYYLPAPNDAYYYQEVNGSSWSNHRIHFRVDKAKTYNQIWIQTDATLASYTANSRDAIVGIDNVYLTMRPLCQWNVIIPNSNPSPTIQSGNYITTNGATTLGNLSLYSFRANNYVEFNEGFSTSEGTEMEAYINACGNYSQFRQGENDNTIYETKGYNAPSDDTEIPKPRKEGYLLYPNPTANAVYLTVEDNFSSINLEQIEIFDMVGNLLSSKRDIFLDKEGSVKFELGELNEGLYLMKVRSGEKLTTLKFVIQK